MIPADVFIAEAEAIAAEEPAYRLGHWGNDGYCDCIGLIIGAIRRAGGQWRGTHGTNYAARREMDFLRRITGSAELQPGEIVFKAREMNEGGWKLPEKYQPKGMEYTGDLRDYYHVGIITSVYPLRIRHMTSPRAKVDTSIGKWNWHGKLKMISFGNGSGNGSGSGKTEENRMKVIIAGGDVSAPIHMRKAASTASAIVADIPQGSAAELIEGGGIWNEIYWGGITGYVMSKFVRSESADQPGGEMITVPRANLEKAYDLLGDLLGLRR